MRINKIYFSECENHDGCVEVKAETDTHDFTFVFSSNNNLHSAPYKIWHSTIVRTTEQDMSRQEIKEAIEFAEEEAESFMRIHSREGNPNV